MEKSIVVYNRKGDKLLLELVVIDKYPTRYAIKRTVDNRNYLSIISKKKFDSILSTAREKGCMIFDYAGF